MEFFFTTSNKQGIKDISQTNFAIPRHFGRVTKPNPSQLSFDPSFFNVVLLSKIFGDFRSLPNSDSLYLQCVDPFEAERLLDTVGQVWIVENHVEAKSFGSKCDCRTNSAWKNNQEENR